MPLAAIREAIAETMYSISAHDLDHACDALGMPAAPEGAKPWDSKRRYVRTRLLPLSRPELEDMVRKVAADIGDDELLALIAPPGLRGVHGELKNLIFAADGPKPRIIL